jgi:hypothetical protein
MFRFMIHFKLIFEYSVRLEMVHFSYVNSPNLLQDHLLKRLSFPSDLPGTFVEIPLMTYVYIPFCRVPLTYIPIILFKKTLVNFSLKLSLRTGSFK